MTSTDARPALGSSAFWRRPLEARMADFADLRETDRFPRSSVGNIFRGGRDDFYGVIHFQDVIAISRDPVTFCSGQGSNTVQDMPADLAEYFGSFIAMDDPRHARQRSIVARAFTPRRLAAVLHSVSLIADDVIDQVCEVGSIDLVAEVSAPFPLRVICEMMGVPRTEFSTVLRATNTILGGGDADFLEGKDLLSALSDAGETLTALVADLAEHRRRNPADDLTTALVHADADNDLLEPEEIAKFFILLATAGNDTTRNAITLGMDLLGRWPTERAAWQRNLGDVTATAVEEIVRMSSPVTFMRRTVTRAVELSGHHFDEGDRLVLFYGAANRDPKVFDHPDRFDVRRHPNNHLGFGGPGPHFCLGAHLARRELAVMFDRLLRRLPDIEVTGAPTYLEASGIPLVSGVKHLPVSFTPTRPRRIATPS